MNGSDPSRTASVATPRTPTADLELTIDFFIIWFGFWLFEKVLPNGLFFVFLELFGRLRLFSLVRRSRTGTLGGFEVYPSRCGEQFLDIDGFLFRPVVVREKKRQLLPH